MRGERRGYKHGEESDLLASTETGRYNYWDGGRTIFLIMHNGN